METALKVKDELEVEENYSEVMANVHPKFYKWISFDKIMLLILIFAFTINIVLISEIT